MKDKITIYNVHGRLVLLYKSSKRVANHSLNAQIDSFDRKQYKIFLDIRYLMIKQKFNLYNLTNQKLVWMTIAGIWRAHLEHVFRRQTPTRDILKCIVMHHPWTDHQIPLQDNRNNQNVLWTELKLFWTMIIWWNSFLTHSKDAQIYLPLVLAFHAAKIVVQTFSKKHSSVLGEESFSPCCYKSVFFQKIFLTPYVATGKNRNEQTTRRINFGFLEVEFWLRSATAW